MDATEFYRRRDQRTHEYLPGEKLPGAFVHVEIGAAAETPAGQLTLLALANQLVRVHRRVTFSLPNQRVPIFISTPFSGAGLDEVLLNTVTTIDPYGHFDLGIPGDNVSVSIGIGNNLNFKHNWYLGADRAIAFLSHEPIGFTDYPGTLRGAALASCLGASAVFRQVLGRSTVPRQISAWNYGEGENCHPGPENLEAINVGRVLMVGAGAVGSALAYWLHIFGVQGPWVIVDGDKVELHNTNRSLPFTPHHAGWPNGDPLHKADVLKALLPNAVPYVSWYDECEQINDEKFDVILGLANDRSVRHLIASRNCVVTLQATTGSNWLSQMHRHIIGKDDCLWCRTGEIETVRFGCSTAPLEVAEDRRTDAALPFLSAASGLMLTTALQRLQNGELATESRNDWRWDFDSDHRLATSGWRHCRDGCRQIHPAFLRRRINAESRWANLDTQ